jgi:hypothetical protein
MVFPSCDTTSYWTTPLPPASAAQGMGTDTERHLLTHIILPRSAGDACQPELYLNHGQAVP